MVIAGAAADYVKPQKETSTVMYPVDIGAEQHHTFVKKYFITVQHHRTNPIAL